MTKREVFLETLRLIAQVEENLARLYRNPEMEIPSYMASKLRDFLFEIPQDKLYWSDFEE